jgi:hypothetical protein
MKKFIINFFIILILTGITAVIISCVTDGGTGTTTQQSPQKAPARGG